MISCIEPIFDKGSFDVWQGGEYPIEGDTDWLVVSVEEMVLTEFIYKCLGFASISIKDGGGNPL